MIQLCVGLLPELEVPYFEVSFEVLGMLFCFAMLTPPIGAMKMATCELQLSLADTSGTGHLTACSDGLGLGLCLGW